MVCLQRTAPTKKSLLTSSKSLSTEGALVTQRSLALLLAPRALMAAATRPSFILHLKLTLAFSRRRVPGCTCFLLNIIFLTIFIFRLFGENLHNFRSQFLLSSHQLVRLAVGPILLLKAQPSVAPLQLVLHLLSIQASHLPTMVVKIRRN